MEYFLYFGAINCFFIPIAIYWLWRQNDTFSFLDNPLSLAGTTHTKRAFVILTSLGVLFQLLFVVYLLSTVQGLSNEILLSLLIVGFAGIFITALTPQGRPRLHRAGIRIMIIAMTAWSFYFHHLLFPISSSTAYVGFALSAFTLIGVPYFFFYLRSKGLTELFFVAIVLIWNLLMTCFLITHFSL